MQNHSIRNLETKAEKNSQLFSSFFLNLVLELMDQRKIEIEAPHYENKSALIQQLI